MKRTVSFLLALFMCIGMVGLLASCDEGDHTHTFATAWSSDATNHWHACTDANCAEVSEKAAHTFVNDVCSVCGYKTTPPEPATNEVSEAQFNAAVTFASITSITVAMEGKHDPAASLQRVAVAIDGNKVKTDTDGLVVYYELLDGYAYGYASYEDDKWGKIRIDESDPEYQGIMTIAFYRDILSDVTFSACTYADGYYTTTVDNEEVSIKLTLGFKGDKLISVRIDDLETVGSYALYTFSKHGATTVTLPEVSGTPVSVSDTEWNSYFAFTNLNATYTYTYEGSGITTGATETIKVADGKWLYQTTNKYYDQSSYPRYTVYFDGTNHYLNGVIDNEVENSCEDMFMTAKLFASYKSSFLEMEEGVYVAESINMYGVMIFDNVVLRVVDDKPVSLTFTCLYTNAGGSPMTEEGSFTFTEVGTTVIDGSAYTQPSVWEAYFILDNVTVEQALVTKIDEQEMPSPSKITWKIDGDRWSSVNTGNGTPTETAYFDGTNGYLDGEMADVEEYEFAFYGFVFFQMAAYEDSFVKTENGGQTIYTAATITLYGTLEYTNVVIVVEGGNVVSFTCTSTDLLGSSTFSMIYTYTFTNYGTTVVENPFA